MDTKSLFKLGYGLYVLTSNYDNKDNGCIINTVMQVSDKPVRIAVSVNKSNFTHDMILNSMVFNVSILTTETPFTVFNTSDYNRDEMSINLRNVKKNIAPSTTSFTFRNTQTPLSHVKSHRQSTLCHTRCSLQKSLTLRFFPTKIP